MNATQEPEGATAENPAGAGAPPPEAPPEAPPAPPAEAPAPSVGEAANQAVPAGTVDPPQIPTFTGENIPHDALRDYTKQGNTRAVKIEGEFQVMTTEGPLTCEDGWLAVDVKGNPYPISAEVFAETYAPTQATEAADHLEALRVRHDGAISALLLVRHTPASSPEELEQAVAQVTAHVAAQGYTVIDRRG